MLQDPTIADLLQGVDGGCRAIHRQRAGMVGKGVMSVCVRLLKNHSQQHTQVQQVHCKCVGISKDTLNDSQRRGRSIITERILLLLLYVSIISGLVMLDHFHHFHHYILISHEYCSTSATYLLPR